MMWPFVESQGRYIYICGKVDDHTYRKYVDVFDKDGNKMGQMQSSYEVVRYGISIEDYQNAENGQILKCNGEHIYPISWEQISYNYKVWTIYYCFKMDYFGAYCGSRNLMNFVVNHLNEKYKDNIESNDFNYSCEPLRSRGFDVFKYIDKTYKNAYPVEVVGSGGMLMYYKIHKTLKPIMFYNYTGLKDYYVEHPGIFDLNTKFINTYFGNKNPKELSLTRKIDISCQFLQNSSKKGVVL